MNRPEEDLNYDIRFPARRKIFWILVVFFSLFAVVFSAVKIENWRGSKAWRNLQRELAAKGERLDWQAFVPPPVPNESNFASVPIFTKLFDYRRDSSGKAVWSDTNAMNENSMSIYVEGSDDSPNIGFWILERKTDLEEWQDYYRKEKSPTKPGEGGTKALDGPTNNPGADILLALSKSDETIRQLREASARPFSRMPIHYAEGYRTLLPHLSKQKSAAQNLSLRASAELDLNQIDAAAQDVILLLRIANQSRDEPYPISQLVRVAMTTVALHPLWEGLVDQHWADHHLKAFQVELEQFDYLRSFHLAMSGERALGVQMIEACRTNRSDLGWIYMDFEEFSKSVPFEFNFNSLKAYSASKLKSAVYHLIPDGWFFQNQVALSRSFQEMLTAVDPVARVVSVSGARETVAFIESDDGFYPYRLISDILLPAYQKIATKMTFEQCAVDLAIVACGLERYRLVHGAFPESLAPLAPQFLNKIPHDVVNGEPLKYSRTPDGKFILYSFGWNETDDGGSVGTSPNGKSIRMEEGDWVWKYPAK